MGRGAGWQQPAPPAHAMSWMRVSQCSHCKAPHPRMELGVTLLLGWPLGGTHQGHAKENVPEQQEASCAPGPRPTACGGSVRGFGTPRPSWHYSPQHAVPPAQPRRERNAACRDP